MSVASALAAARRAARSRMTSAALIKREGAPTTVGGLQVPGWDVVHAAVPCWVDGTNATRTVTIGQTEMQVASRVLKVPHDTTGLRDGDVVAISGGACDGRFFRVVEATIADQKKQQEIPVVEIQEPEGWSV